MTSEQFKAALAADLQEIFARNPDVSQRVISEATGLGPTSLNKYMNYTNRTINMPLGTYLHLIQEFGRHDMLKASHPAAALLSTWIRNPTFFDDSKGRQGVKLYDYLKMMMDRGQKVEASLFAYYKRRVP